MILKHFTSLIIVCALIGCERQSNISISIKNIDDSPVDSVAVLVTGKSYQLGRILSNDSVVTKVNPTAASHLEIGLKSSKAGRKHFVVESYFEPGYSGFMNVSINSDSVVSVKNSITIPDTK